MSDNAMMPNQVFRGRRAGQYSRGAPSRRSSLDADTRRLLMFAGGVAAVLLALIVASFVTGHRSGQVPVVSADTAPIRVKPDNPGGLKVDAAESDVFSGGSDGAGARLAPAAEAPDTRALHEAEVPDTRPAHEAEAPPRPGVAAAPRVLQTVPPVPPAAVPPAQGQAPVQGQAAGQASASVLGLAPAASVPAPIPVPAPARESGVATASLVRPVLPPLPAPRPETRGAGRADEHAAASHATAKPEAHPAAAGRPVVQIATMPSEAGAREEWLRLSRRLPELFSGHAPMITRVEHDGHALWRLRTSGFADMAKARAFCEQVHAKGGACSVTDS